MSEIEYQVLKILEDNPEVTQRELADELGISLGKTNYCIRALCQKGYVKARNFRKSNNKLAYAYLLTPRGVRQKGRLALKFLDQKMKEFDMLKHEIAQLQMEVNKND